MNKLEEARVKINEIDREMAELFVERMKAVEKVIEYKFQHNMKILDSNREKDIIQKNKAFIIEKKYERYYLSFILEIMRISKEYQGDILGRKDWA